MHGTLIQLVVWLLDGGVPEVAVERIVRSLLRAHAYTLTGTYRGWKGGSYRVSS